MGFDAGQFRRLGWKHAVFFGVVLQALPLTACSGDADSDVAQSTDPLKGGVPAGGKDKNKDKTNNGHAGSPGNAHSDGGVDEDKAGNGGKGHGQGAAGSVGGQGQGHGQGRSNAGADASETHGKSGQAHAGSRAQGPKAGHGADDDDMNDEADEMP